MNRSIQTFMDYGIKVLLICVVFGSLNAQETGINTIKSRIYQSIIEDHLNAPSNATIEDFDENINQISSDFDGEKWPFIQYSDVSREGFDNRIHLNNLVKMAVAYKSNASKYFKDKSLFQKIINGLHFWCKNDFVGENWWNNQIGTPTSLIELMLVIGEQLPGGLIAKSQEIINRADINKGGSRPGGDRIKVSSIAAKNQLFLNDQTQFELIINIIENEIKFVDWIGNDFGYTYSKSNTGGFNEFLKANGRGLQYDYSFHHRTDGVNNTLSYGLGWADAFVEWAYYVRNTDYAFSSEKTKILVNYYLDGVCKTSVYGVKPDFAAKNRSISRIGSTKAFNNEIPEKIVALTDYRSDELKEIIKLRSKPTDVRPISHATFYWNSEHFTFQRPNFYSSVRLYSSRNMNMESPYNSEGLLNHHRGDGANHIYVNGNEYDDISPVLDYQKIPGTTVVQKDQLPHHREIKKLGLTDFVGAATDGRYGVVGFDFKSIHDPLVARKSWFFFDNQYVCMGSGISAKSKNEVCTTINQCHLNGEVNVSTKGKQLNIDKGLKAFEQVDWIHHNGVAYFPLSPQKINIQNEEVSGSWWSINKQIDSPKDKVNKDVFKVWFNHGPTPDNASYTYIVRPNTLLDELKQGNHLNPIKILSNTPYLQAVHHTKLNLIQAVFYRSDHLMLGEDLKIQATAPCIVMFQMNENEEIERITVSDPNRKLSALLLRVSKKFEINGESFKSRWMAEEGLTEFIIDLPQAGYSGQSVSVEIN
jgi:chondroitin AC lyase